MSAASASALRGFQPGFVFLDEPLQQNPDPEHRALFIEFLTKTLAHTNTFQTIIFTTLSDDEIARLHAHGTSIQLPQGAGLLKRGSSA